MLEALFRYEFLQNAVLAGLLTSVVCGIIGVIAATKKTVMMSGGIAHSAYGGVGLGYLLGIEPMIGAALFALLSAFAIGYIERHSRAKSDVLTAMIWSLGMALGIVFLSLMPGYVPEVDSYLFGNILSVTKADLVMMALLTAAVVLVIGIFFNDFKAFLFDKDFSHIVGLRTTLMDYGLLAMTALSVVVLIKATGIILVIALLSVPASIAALLAKSLRGRMITAMIFGAFFCLFGIGVSYYLSVASGASIVIVSVVTYLLVFAIKKIR